MKPVLLDTGPIVALLDPTDASHDVCARILGDLRAPLVTCEAVIAESCYLLHKMSGASSTILENVAAGIFQIPLIPSQSAHEISLILQRYRDRQIDLADACLIHLANEFGTGEILTLDRDFHVYRWGKNKAFEFLIPRA